MTLTELNKIKQNYKVLEIAVDFINPSYNISRAKHLDNARYLICTLTENGIPRTVKADEAARIRLQKPDRTYVYNDCDILEDGRVFITLTEQILASEGNAVCDIQLTDENTGIIYSTKNFIINIDKTAVNNSVMESTNEFGALNNLIATNKKLNDRLNANEDTRQANETNRIENENDRQENEADRKNSEAERENAEAVRVISEKQRTDNENIRQSNETIRQTQEADRETNTAAAVSDAEKAAQKANAASDDLQNKLNSHHFVLAEDKGVANGVAELDSNGLIPSGQLPSYVDDVIEGYYNPDGGNFYNTDNNKIINITGETGKIYVDLNTNKTYRWSGSSFVVISETIALGETSSTAYRGDRGKTAYEHSQSLHAPANAEENQNAFSNVAVGSATVSAGSKTDTLTLVAGDNITLTPNTDNNKIIISGTGGGDGVSGDYLPLTGGTVTGPLVLSYNADGSGTADQKVPLIVGGTKDNLHIFIDSNEIGAKRNATTPSTLNLNTDGGEVQIGNGGLTTAGHISSGRFQQTSPINENPEIYQVITTNTSDGNYFRKSNLNNFKKYLQHGRALALGNNENNGAGYIKLFNITLTSDYMNAPMKFLISRRNVGFAEIEVLFNNGTLAGGMTLQSCSYRTARGDAYTIYYKKNSSSSYDFYVYTGTSYDCIELLSYEIPQYLRNGVQINTTTSFSTTAPSDLVQIQPNSYATISTKANSLEVKPNNPSSNSSYRIPFGRSNISTYNTALTDNDGIIYNTHEGSTSTIGVGRLMLGNTTVSGTAGNKRGSLRLYSEKNGYIEINPVSTTESIYINVPATGGTLLNTGTTGVTQSSTSGTAIGTIKINNVNTTLYAPSTSSVTSGSTALLTSGGAYIKFLRKVDYVAISAGQTVTITGVATKEQYQQNYYRFTDFIQLMMYQDEHYGANSEVYQICGGDGDYNSSTINSISYNYLWYKNTYYLNPTFVSASFDSSKLTLKFKVSTGIQSGIIFYTPNMTSVTVS